MLGLANGDKLGDALGNALGDALRKGEGNALGEGDGDVESNLEGCALCIVTGAGDLHEGEVVDGIIAEVDFSKFVHICVAGAQDDTRIPLYTI